MQGESISHSLLIRSASLEKNMDTFKEIKNLKGSDCTSQDLPKDPNRLFSNNMYNFILI